MTTHYAEYYWKNGKPYGRGPVDPRQSLSSYKISADPYFKWISVEKYHKGAWEKNVYDSSLLDFRLLSMKDQTGWQRELVREEPDATICLLRDQNDRAVFFENCFYENNQCRRCEIRSVHDILLCTHRMSYQYLEDDFNGIVLYDSEECPVMRKVYEIDPSLSEFTQLLEENWNIRT